MHINILTFSPIVETVQLDAYTEKTDEKYPQSLFRDEFPELWEQNPELENKERLFFSVFNAREECKGDKYTVEINLYEHIRIAKHYFNQSFYQYFKQSEIVGIDYIDNVEVWIKDTKQNDKNTTQYLRFSLIPKYKNITEDWELVVSFNGHSVVYNQSIDKLDIRTERFRVITGGEVVKHKNLTPQQKQDITNIFPVINKELGKELNVAEHRTKVSNKYTQTLEKITNFARKYLFTEDFKNVIAFSADSFIPVPEANIKEVYDNSNALLFGNKQIGYDPYTCLFGSRDNDNAYGPYFPTAKNVQFFFIYHKPLTNISLHLYNIFLYGVDSKQNLESNPNDKQETIDLKENQRKRKYYKSLGESIKQPFSTTKGSSITFDNIDTAVAEVETQLAQKFAGVDTTKTQYIALYISPVSKDDVNSPHHSIYYKIKEMLLDKRITSQVINKDNPSKSAFKYHLPNIATAILAKIGGIPWLLQTQKDNNDLIVGVGAFRSEKIGKRYVGSAFCFNNNGVFQNFASYKDKDIEALVSDIRKAIGVFLVNNQDSKPNRLIIHYYKTMSRREAKPITDMLFNLGFNIPIFIVTINKTEASDFVAFDTELSGLMPMSGTFIKIGYNQFLLYNNSRYKNSQKYDFLFPVKVKISKVYNTDNEEDKKISMLEVKGLLNQVYQFSRMYWKSVKQQNLPITIKYPEMVAEIVPHFSDAELPPFGKTNLWFL